MLMFIGGGSAGTAGGLKVTTVIVLFLVIVAEVRGDDDVIAFDRRIDHRIVRQATTVALLGVAAVGGSTILLSALTNLPLRDVAVRDHVCLRHGRSVHRHHRRAR